MNKITIVGSGASGVHFADSLLDLGYEVRMIDVGYSGPEPVMKDATFNQLKDKLEDPVNYFLGENFESVIPSDSSEVYEFPPNKKFVFKIPPGYKTSLKGFAPHLSFAKGGLAEAWTGGSYPFNDSDLEDFPFNYKDIEPFYELIAKKIGIIGVEDDLSRFFPIHKNLLPPMNLDENSQILSDEYEKKFKNRDKNRDVFLGRSRIATLSEDIDERKKCDYSGRCQWGCPSDSLYVPSITLKKLLKNRNFTYFPDYLVKNFNYSSGKKIVSLSAINILTGEYREFPVEVLVLAAGTIATSKIYLDSILKKSGKRVKLYGLMDNRQILAPIINLRMLGKQFNPETYQYHQLATGIQTENPKEYIHGQITTLKTGLMQPPFQSMPVDFRTAIFLGRYLHSALGVVNINFHDFRRRDNYITLSEKSVDGETILEINYLPPAGEKERINFSLKKFRKFFKKIGVIMPLFQAQSRPMGASVHYSGTIPMSEKGSELTVNPNCRSNDFHNLYIADGSTFPFLPSKNITFTLMANAARIVESEFNK